ncbi:MAG: P63C domain-containing protein [Arenimonas sp.]
MKEKNASKVIGGNARKAALAPSERTKIAREAAEKRWSLPQTQYVGVLKIGEMTFPCSVLSDGTRILTQSDFMTGMGMYYSGWVANNPAKNKDGSSADLPHFLQFKALEPFIHKHLGDLQSVSLKYITEHNKTALGIKAEIIPKICEVWMDADENGKLGARQKEIAKSAKLMMRALAHVGIIALVDEATGFQRHRGANALAEILEKYIAKELQPWIKTFPDEFYEELFRLRGMHFPNDTVRKPQYFGHLTNDIVYGRIAPAVLEELKKTTPKDEKGRRKHKFFQKLTPEIGNPKLREHMASVLTIMKLSDNYQDFHAKLDRIHPTYNQTLNLPLDIGNTGL